MTEAFPTQDNHDSSPIALEQGTDGHAEKADFKPVTTIDVRRHSEYEGGFPKAGWGKPTDEEKLTLGHLTEIGVENARRVAREIVEKRLAEAGGQVDFLVLASPTYWLGDEQLGQRAIETAKIYSEEVEAQLKAHGLPPEHLLNTVHSESLQHPIGNVRKTRKMVEAQMFDDPVALEAVVDGLREKYKGQGEEFWNAWYDGVDNEALKSVGAETSAEAADRADRQMQILARYGNMHNKATGRSLEVIVLTHHEVLQPYALHKLGVSPADFLPGKNEGLEIRVEDGKSVATVAGRQIEATKSRSHLAEKV